MPFPVAFMVGFTELVRMLVLLVMYVGLPTLLIVVVYNYLDGKRGYEERIAGLEQRVAELEQEQSTE
ncbi:hypothetical protein [Haloarcula pellucida]|uniref:Uncharacterized protein n=1 Tax=Haloarcula pellucida TaxID=1427151 RepID=A0A830GLJ9_9EURY|nr:hypothetical protein [Halomicroarcula pellucida]MBX0348428.1 hypothetical protein [Halomicroarcula pellucida]GGN93394.1 hypothetical protein GCM10009030_18800 [Halomicroarcula pellucida]